MIHFGTGGFRGKIENDFNKQNIKLIAEGIARLYKEKKATHPIVVGYDFRLLSYGASIWIAETLVANDIPVIRANEPSPTPAIMEISKEMRNEFGVMITASHNPYNYNGVKLFQKEGMDAEVGLTNHLEEIISNLDSYSEGNYKEFLDRGLIEEMPVIDHFVNNILSFVDVNGKKKDFKILLDPIYGTGLLTLKPLLEKMGFTNIKMIHGIKDSYFGGLLPNPIEKNMLQDKELLLKENFDICIGTDSDCDRIAILDEFGNYVDANEIMASIYYYLVRYRHLEGDIIKNVATSDLIDAVSSKLGFKTHEVDVGFKNISAGIKEHNALLGGESSGGLTMRGYIFGKDSTFATALFMEMLSYLGKSVSSVIEEVRNFASFYKIELEDSLPLKDVNKIKDALRKNDPSFNEKLLSKKEIGNNFKYRFINGDWMLIRFSGTEPLIRLFFETDPKNKENALKEIETIKSFIKDVEK